MATPQTHRTKHHTHSLAALDPATKGIVNDGTPGQDPSHQRTAVEAWQSKLADQNVITATPGAPSAQDHGANEDYAIRQAPP